MNKQKSWQALYGANAELLSEVRGWLGYTQEQLAVTLNCTHRSYWLWESGEVYPNEQIWQKLMELVKKEAKNRFRSDFLKNLCGVAGVNLYVEKGGNQFRPKTEKEILREIESSKELVNHLMNNVFAKKSPDLKNLSFRAAFTRYCRIEMDMTPRMLLNRFPAPDDVRKIREDRRKRKPKKTPCSFNRNKTVSIRLKEAKSQKKRRGEKTTSDGGGDKGPDGDPEPPGLGFAISEAGLKEFIDLYHRKYGIELEKKEAQRSFSELLMLFSILLREG